LPHRLGGFQDEAHGEMEMFVSEDRAEDLDHVKEVLGALRGAFRHLIYSSDSLVDGFLDVDDGWENEIRLEIATITDWMSSLDKDAENLIARLTERTTPGKAERERKLEDFKRHLETECCF
jgi:hypothetical protein